MSTPGELNDQAVADAADGSTSARDCLAAVMNDRIRIMVYARLNPTSAQHGAVEEISQQCIEGVLRGLPELQNRTAAGLRAFASAIVARRVADYIRDPAGVGRGRPAPASLDSVVAGYSTAGPLWQFLSASGTSPLSAAAREDQLRRTMTELAQLREEYRNVITLAFFDQLSTAQIAEKIGTTREAAAMTLLRAIRALRKRVIGLSEVGG